ncbi:heavy-metal-associated domain-containing protein [Sphingomonas ginsenosidivorax]|uniref:Heavy-metal-associated domain-containing protein n=1 Tax=Sphingomonas ginsenosidivorax TaxID=862135 RepID=A0A5C6UEQ1_9SPHN|nr:heavy-metal-associated domain-containing protein [Sphingomonas ginsenosidivorax]TXC70515.1 heavy-metal-associated domain-containing protein [Sphingomonas ginsenosidivorax]
MTRIRPLPAALAGALLLLGGGAVVAQIEGGTAGTAPVDSGSAYEVSGVAVDVAGKSADAARLGGWRLAQRKAWVQLSKRLGGGGGLVSDGTLDSIVSGIVVENEQIGPDRYIAKLGVLFNRARAGSILGISSYADRSPPMLVIPVEWSGGVGRAFEQPTAWQQAWARFRTGNSSVDYVRPAGSGPDALLLNIGQIQRPGRGWWRTIIDQYGANDVLIPVVKLYRQWPGGPIIGVFEARHGPDNDLIGRFTLRVGNADGLPQLLDTGVKRIDDLYQRALRSGELRVDPSLSPPPPPEAAIDDTLPDDGLVVDDAAAAAASGAGIPIIVQFDTPQASVISATEAALRGIPGVRSASTTSLALGGVSLMRVTYDGDPEALKTALEVRGYQVFGSGQTLRIRRVSQLLPPDLPADTATAG